MQQILRIRLTPHSYGWSNKAWGLVCDAAKLHPRDRGSFQAQAAATLMDFDAHLLERDPGPCVLIVLRSDRQTVVDGRVGTGAENLAQYG